MAKQLHRIKYANSVTISVCRKIAKFCFGDFFVQAKPNAKEQRFDIYLQSSVETSDGIIHLKKEDLDYFNENWCANKQWKVTVWETSHTTNETNQN